VAVLEGNANGPLPAKLKREAEEIVFGKISTGAQNDLERITKLAYAMVTMYGMNKNIGNTMLIAVLLMPIWITAGRYEFDDFLLLAEDPDVEPLKGEADVIVIFFWNIPELLGSIARTKLRPQLVPKLS
jgi:hypothetical protein